MNHSSRRVEFRSNLFENRFESFEKEEPKTKKKQQGFVHSESEAVACLNVSQ